MNTVKNVHLLDLPVKAREKLEAGALLHKRMSNITFKVLDVDESSIVVRVTQGRHLSGNYADKKTLVERTRELFDQFVDGRKIHVRAFPYHPNPVSQIDAQWVKMRMEDLDIAVKDIVDDTGIDKTNISAWANGTRPMSQPVKAMFFHYFQAKKAVK